MMKLRDFFGLKSRRGALALECAVVAPIFIVVALGIVEIGRGVMINNIVTDAAHEGALTATCIGATNDDVNSSVQAFLASALGIAASEVTVAISTTPNTGNPDPANNVANCSKGDLINVRVQVPFHHAAFVTKYLGGQTLVGSCSLRHE